MTDLFADFRQLYLSGAIGKEPRIANYQSCPHLFESEWRDIDSDDTDTFLLSPVDEATFHLALEDWAIWLRLQSTYDQGHVLQDTHPALPEERTRHEELQHLLEERLVVDSASAVRKAAEFRTQGDTLEVQWIDGSFDG